MGEDNTALHIGIGLPPVARLRAMLHGLRRPWINWLLRAGVAACLMTLLLLRVNLAEVAREIASLEVRTVALALLLSLAYRCTLACQIALGLRPLQVRLSVARLLKVVLIAGFYSLVLPGNLVAGGLASWYKLRSSTHSPVDAAALVTYLRLINTSTILVIGLLGMAADVRVASPGLILAVILLLGGMVFLLAPFVSTRAAQMARRFGVLLCGQPFVPEWFRGRLGPAWRAVTAFNELPPSAVASISGLSVLSNAVSVWAWYVLAHALGIRLSLVTVGWITAVLSVIQMIPVSIGGLGMREGSLVLLLGRYDVPPPLAVGFSLTAFCVAVVFGLAGALLEVWDTLHGIGRLPPGGRAMGKHRGAGSPEPRSESRPSGDV